MTTQKAMTCEGGGRAGATAAKMVRCKIEDEHEGAVFDVTWDSSNTFMTGGRDGGVKLWESKEMKCIRTSEGVLVANPVMKVACGVTGKVTTIVAALRNGDLLYYTGLTSIVSDGGVLFSVQMTETRIPYATFVDTPHAGIESPEIMALHISPSSSTILASYKSHPLFYRVLISLSGPAFEHARFGHPSCPITAIAPSFACHDLEQNFVITGDQLGTARVYDWNSSLSQAEDNLIIQFHAHTFAVTAIAHSPTQL